MGGHRNGRMGFMLDPALFHLPAEKRRTRYYPDKDFARARDICVTRAMDGMKVRGLLVPALRDATWGSHIEPEEKTPTRPEGLEPPTT